MAVDFKKLLGENYTDEVASVLQGIESKLLLNDGSFIPKSRFDEVNNKFRVLESEIEVERKNNLTAEEKLAEAVKAAEMSAKQYQVKSNRLEVEKEFVAAGIKDYDKYIDNIVSADLDSSINVAKNIVATVTNATAIANAELEKMKLQATPQPGTQGAKTGSTEKLNYTELAQLKASDPKAYDAYQEANK